MLYCSVSCWCVLVSHWVEMNCLCLSCYEDACITNTNYCCTSTSCSNTPYLWTWKMCKLIEHGKQLNMENDEIVFVFKCRVRWFLLPELVHPGWANQQNIAKRLQESWIGHVGDFIHSCRSLAHNILITLFQGGQDHSFSSQWHCSMASQF